MFGGVILFALYTFISILFIFLGMYLYSKNSRAYVFCYGMSIVLNYYSAFFILFFELASSKNVFKKALSFIVELIPINIVYIVEHFVFKEKTVCFWLPDFQLWNDLFDVHCMKVFYWFWAAYILLLCYALVLSLNDKVDDLEKGVIGGLGVYTIFSFFVHIDLTFFMYMTFFIIYFSCKYLDLKCLANLYMVIALMVGIILNVFAIGSFGFISNFVQMIYDKLSFLGISAIVLAMIAAISVDFIWQWNKKSL